MNKICFIIPYFGPLKWWHSYFFKSIAANTNHTWLIIADQINERIIPANVKLVSMSLQEFNLFVSKTLKIKTNITHAFKICDFKPAFGHIFFDYLKNYDYWAYCDTDIILGDLDSFLSHVLNSDYDVISPDDIFYPGHFLLLKNCEKMNMLYKDAINYRQVFFSKKCYCFDEFLYPKGLKLTNGSIKKFSFRKILLHRIRMRIASNSFIKWFSRYFRKRGNKKVLSKEKLSDFNKLLYFFEIKNEIKVYRKSLYDSDVTRFRKGQRKWNVQWNKGKLFNEDHEILYFHFQYSKYNEDLKIDESLGEPNFFELKTK